MRSARRQHRAAPTPPHQAAKRFDECLRLLHSGETLTPERAAAVERAQAAAPYRPHPQAELELRS